MAGSVDGRRFRAVDPAGSTVDQAGSAEVGTDTYFEYHQDGDLVWARYAGGAVRLGHLVGLRHGNELDFRYSQLNTAGETSTGHCLSTIHELPDGRLQLRETWRWESRDGAGTSVVEEVA